MSDYLFRDRAQAGRELAGQVAARLGGEEPLILGLPRGGVPVAFEIARGMRAQLDIFMAGKLGHPEWPELALGAVTADGTLFLNADSLERAGLTRDDAEEMALRKRIALERQEALYRQGAPPPLPGARSVVVADDGAATGATLVAALRALKHSNPRRLLAALPVSSRAAMDLIRGECEDVICLKVPWPFYSVGEWYEEFEPVPDREVVRCLLTAKAWHWSPIPDRKPFPPESTVHAYAVEIPCGQDRLEADLAIPGNPRGLVIFAHGSGSGRNSPRNRKVAAGLNGRGFATLLVDLLTQAEDEGTGIGRGPRFDIGLLTDRLLCATRRMEADPRVQDLPIGFFGASTGAAAALRASARLKEAAAAVVTRGGRVDLAGDCLPEVTAPCLFIVGGDDYPVLEANREAYASLRAVKRLEVVPGATHLFEEPGALEKVESLAAGWFTTHLAVVARGSAP